MAKINLQPFLLFTFIASGLSSTNLDFEFVNKREMDRVKKLPLLKEEHSKAPDEAIIHTEKVDDYEYLLANKKKMFEILKASLPKEEPSLKLQEQLPELAKFEEEEAITLGADFLSLLGYVVKKYPSAIMGLYHAIRHDVDNSRPNNLTIWEIWALNEFLTLKPKIYEQLLELSIHHDECIGQRNPADMDKIKRDLFAGLVMDLGRNVVAFSPTAWEISRTIIKYAYPAQILRVVDEGIRYAVIATPLAYAGVGIDMVNTAALLKRGEHFVFTSFKFMPNIFPRELIKHPVKKSHQKGSYLERWIVGAISLIICELNHVSVLANYGHLGVNLAQLAVISACLFPGGALPGTVAGLTLASIDKGITVRARYKSKDASAHKDIIISLVGRLLSSNVMVDYLKDLGILQKSQSARVLRANMAKLGEEKTWAVHSLMSLVFKHYLFP